jgi:DNA-binding MarR family transcriptional regulator
MDHQMSTYDFGSGQHGFIFFLYDHNGVSQDEISKALELDKATTARAIQKLEDSGYIIRKTSEKDKRINHVFLTDKAYGIQKEIRQFSAEWTAILTEGLTDDDLVQLQNLLSKLTHNAHHYKTVLTKKGE